MSSVSAPSARTNVRVVLVGDRATGKSSLIASVMAERFVKQVAPVLPPTRLPADFYPDNVPLTLIDTSSSLENRGKLAEELKRADVVVLTYACDQPSTLKRLSTFWLHELRRLQIKVPVIVVGCKLDKRDADDPMSLEQMMAPMMQQFREIETCMECSVVNMIQVPDVFYYAQRAVIHPVAPLFDQELHTLKPRCARALKRIFILCDRDMDGALNDEELNYFQVKCFDTPLKPDQIAGVKNVVQEKLPEGINELGLTLAGFLYLNAFFIEKGRTEIEWLVLRKFGYNDEVKLREDYMSSALKRASDQSVELTSEAIEFLKGVFSTFDSDKDGVLQCYELEDLFSTAPESPWEEFPYKDAVERAPMGGISLNAFLCEWAFMTLLDPAQTSTNLIYIGYNCDTASALNVTRRRSVDRKKKKSERFVYQCLVLGPTYGGKSTLLNSFLGRPFSEEYSPTSNGCYAVNVVDRPVGSKKTLVLHEIPEDGLKKVFSDKDCLATCDVAAFVYDSSDEYSLKQASELLVDFAMQANERGYGIPCLLVASKDDLDFSPRGMKDSEKICEDMGIDAPVSISAKDGDLNSVFHRIVSAAEHPHLNIPKTGRNKTLQRQLVNRSLMVISVGAAVAVVGLAAYRAYASRKNSSS